MQGRARHQDGGSAGEAAEAAPESGPSPSQGSKNLCDYSTLQVRPIKLAARVLTLPCREAVSFSDLVCVAGPGVWAGPGPAEPGSRGEGGQGGPGSFRVSARRWGGGGSGSISQADTAREPALRPRVYKHDQTPALATRTKQQQEKQKQAVSRPFYCR